MSNAWCSTSPINTMYCHTFVHWLTKKRLWVTVAIIIIIDHLYMVLFSALEQTPCTPVLCDSGRVTVAFRIALKKLKNPPKLCNDSDIWLCGWCHMKLLPSQPTFCVHHTTMRQFSHFIWSNICSVHVCSAVTCHLHFWQNDWDLLCATAVTQGQNGYWNKGQHRMLTLEKKICPMLLHGLKPMNVDHESNHWAIPTPHQMADNSNKEVAALAASYLPFQSWDERTKAITSSSVT